MNNRKDTVIAVKVCLLNKTTLIVVETFIYSRHMFRTPGTYAVLTGLRWNEMKNRSTTLRIFTWQGCGFLI